MPEVLDRVLIDEVIPVTDDQAYKTAARLARQEFLSSGENHSPGQLVPELRRKDESDNLISL